MEDLNIKNENNVYSDWIAFPRKIVSMYRNGDISRPEYIMLLHLRMHGNPYGIGYVNLEGLRNDVYGKCTGKHSISINYVNRILLSLKKKRLIFYQDRAGRSGSFEVRFPDFIDPNKNITDINRFYESAYSNRPDSINIKKESEVNTQVNKEIQRCEIPFPEAIKTSNILDENNKNRGYNNDTDTENDIKNTELSVANKGEKKDSEQPEYVCKNQTDSFVPNDRDTYMAHAIAQEIGEKCMDRYLALIKRGYFWVIEKAVGELREDLKKGKAINDKPAYMNGIMIRMLKEKIGK